MGTCSNVDTDTYGTLTHMPPEGTFPDLSPALHAAATCSHATVLMCALTIHSRIVPPAFTMLDW